jgi:hypothetical protein
MRYETVLLDAQNALILSQGPDQVQVSTGAVLSSPPVYKIGQALSTTTDEKSAPLGNTHVSVASSIDGPADPEFSPPDNSVDEPTIPPVFVISGQGTTLPGAPVQPGQIIQIGSTMGLPCYLAIDAAPKVDDVFSALARAAGTTSYALDDSTGKLMAASPPRTAEDADEAAHADGRNALDSVFSALVDQPDTFGDLSDF